MVEHNKIKQLISAYFDNEVSSGEKQLVENHIIECPDCQQYYQQLQKLSASLNSWENESLSCDFEQKIQQLASQAKSQEDNIMKTQTSSRNIKLAASFLVCILAVVLSLQVYVKRGIQGRLRSDGEKIGGKYQTERIAYQRKPKHAQGAYFYKTTKGTLDGLSEVNEPYFLSSDYKVDEDSAKKTLAASSVRTSKDLNHKKEVKARRLSTSLKLARGRMEGPVQRSAASAQAISAETPQNTIDSYSGSIIVGGKIDEKLVLRDHDIGQPIRGFGGGYPHTEEYDLIYENEFLDVSSNPLSTFSIDVDTASYSNVRRFLTQNQLPPKDAVRIEEMVNYFVYDYPQPKRGDAFSITTEAAPCPWNTQHDLVMIGLQGKELSARETPPSNLVFLIDVSGSMNDPQKLPLLKSAFRIMVQNLRPEEKVSIVTYAGAAGLVLDSTPGYDKARILSALERLSAGGSTAGGQGIKLAYDVAKRNLIPGGNNRVILATDGDFNVGLSSNAELVRLIEDERDNGIFLSVLGFGTGNYKDSKMEQLADKGNGNYYYIDNLKEAEKVLVKELGSLLFTIAKDVKLQIEFNPSQIKAYRLIGYENRILAKEDFNDDTKDAGELGAGHTVTAFYEIVPADSYETYNNVDPLKYQKAAIRRSNDLMTVKLRYKKPDENQSRLIERTLSANDIEEGKVSNNFLFASAVAEFGLVLRDSQFKGYASMQNVLSRARQAIGQDNWGYRQEFIRLAEMAWPLLNQFQTYEPDFQQNENYISTQPRGVYNYK